MESQSLMVLLLVFCIALYALMKGADFMVEGASSLAFRLGVSPLVIGLTVIAFGTSLPELVVSIQSSMAGSSQLALSNVVGSNIANILCILGVTAMVQPLRAPDRLRKDIPFKLILAVVFLGMIAVSTNLLVINNVADASARLERWGGAVLIVFFSIFMARIFMVKDKDLLEAGKSEATDSTAIAWLKTLGGIAVIVAGGKYTVDAAVGMARMMSIAESTIGMTIVAMGTSLPELVASVASARKGYDDIAIGNVVGSNIFNLTLVLGVSGLISPINLGPFETLDTTVMTIITLVFLGYLTRNSTYHIGRKTGALWFVMYLGYMGFIAMRSIG